MSTSAPLKLVYAFDPLCGWCFAFAPTTRALLERFETDQVEWEVMCGGLVTGERVAPISQMRGYLEQGMRAVEARTPVRFGKAFREEVLAKGTWVSQSEPACRATLVAQKHEGGRAALGFGSALSRAFYEEGLLPDDPKTWEQVGDRVGLDGVALAKRAQTEEAKELTKAAFARARSQGVQSYPTLYQRKEGKLSVLLPGYAPAKDAVAMVQEVLRG